MDKKKHIKKPSHEIEIDDEDIDDDDPVITLESFNWSDEKIAAMTDNLGPDDVAEVLDTVSPDMKALLTARPIKPKKTNGKTKP